MIGSRASVASSFCAATCVVALLSAVTLIAMLVQPTAAAIDPTYFLQHTNSCFSTGFPSRKPPGLTFCTWYSEESCCLPALDEEIMGAYATMMALGSGCSSAKHSVKSRYKEIRDLICLPCSPEEPAYRLRTNQGDTHLGGVIPADTSAPDGDFTWRICKSFLYGHDRVSGLWGPDGSKFDDCGFFSSACIESQRYLHNSTDGTWVARTGTECAEPELVIPRLKYTDEADPAASFAQHISVQIDGFQFVIVDDSSPSYDASRTPCFAGGSSQTNTMVALCVTALVSVLFLV